MTTKRSTFDTIRSAGSAFSLKAGGAALAFAFNIVLARFLGAEGAGIYYLALTLATITSVLGRIGLDNALLRFVAADAEGARWDRVRGAFRLAMRLGGGASLIAAAALAALAPILSPMLDPALRLPLWLSAISVVPFGLLNLHAEALKGMGRISAAMFVQGVGVPLGNILFFTTLAAIRVPTPELAMAAYALSTLTVLALASFFWRRSTPLLRNAKAAFDRSELLQASTPLLWVAGLNLVMIWASTLLLGVHADSRAVGHFSIATRTATLVNFVLIAVNSTVAPRFAALHARGARDELANLARRTATTTTLVALPALALFLVAPEMVLAIFGSDFEDAALPLTVLALGQFVNVATGSVGYLLMMSGNEKLMRNNVAAAAALNLAFNLVLIPLWGAVGAAVATALSVAIMNTISVVLVRRALGIWPLPLLPLLPLNRNL